MVTELRQDVRTVVVVGGSGGIGGAIAQAFAGEPDTTVIATAATEAELEQARVDPRLTNVDLRHLDVRSDDGVGDLMAGIGRLDVLVNAAGVPAGPKDFEIDGFVRTIEVNLVGTARASYAAYPLLRRARLGDQPCFGDEFPWERHGAGVRRVERRRRPADQEPCRRLGSRGAGQRHRSRIHRHAHDREHPWRCRPQRPDTERTPAGRWGRPDEIADAATFLASAAANFVNGTVLAVDGGYLAL